MIINSVVMIGLGSLGSHVIMELSKRANAIILIDNDRVYKKNLEFSVYRENQVGKWKSDAMAEILTEFPHDYKFIRPSFGRFYGESYWKENYKFVVDCSDSFFNLNNTVDIKLYISGRNLVIDLRNDKIYQGWGIRGHYITAIEKSDFINIATIFGKFLEEVTYEEIVDFNDFLVVDLNSKISSLYQYMKRAIKLPKPEESNYKNDSIILNLSEEVYNLLYLFRNKDIIRIKSSNSNETIVLSKNHLHSYQQIKDTLNEFAQKTLSNSKCFLVVQDKENISEINLVTTFGGA